MDNSSFNLRKRKPGKISGDNAVIEAAWLYYHQGLNQNDIAKRLDVSRATIVNYLQEARELGMIQITLRAEVFTTHKLGMALCDKFGLISAYIVPDTDHPEDRLNRAALGASQWLPNLLKPGDRLGVAWGQTIYALTEQLEPTSITDLTVLQLVGCMATPYGFAAEVCSARLAQKLDAQCISLHVPAIVSEPAFAARLREEPIIHDQLNALSTCNKTMFAVGTCTADSHVVKSGVATEEELAWYVERGATGVLCGRFIDASGEPIDGPLTERLMGITLPKMKDMDVGLLVSVGDERVNGMRAAIAGGYVTHIVTDAATAQTLLGDG